MLKHTAHTEVAHCEGGEMYRFFFKVKIFGSLNQERIGSLLARILFEKIQ